MCRPKGEGGRRCRIRAHLENLELTELLPEPQSDRPEVTWIDEPEPWTLWTRYPPAVANEAVAILLEARQDEGQITTDFLAASPDLDGLAFRMKSPSSLARKIAGRIEQRSAHLEHDAQTVASAMTDLLRYTALVNNHDHLVPSLTRTIENLGAKGHIVVEASHSYVAGNVYKGVHLLLKTPAGRTVELQIHSAISQRVKDEIHHDYEIERDLDRPWDERRSAHARMVARSDTLPQPHGLDQVTSVAGVDMEVKTYINRYEGESR